MTESSRSDPAHAHDGALEADRDAKIEQLLLIGLDHYFAAQYEQAINVWTRALFLDRSHPRARAYIDRARRRRAGRRSARRSRPPEPPRQRAGERAVALAARRPTGGAAGGRRSGAV